MREQGTVAEWSGWDGSGHEVLTLGYETGGWTADGVVRPSDAPHSGIHYVVRVDEQWRLRQFLLFRDLPDPDLWLGVTPAGQWGEINGARRPELDGCTEVDLGATPFTNTLPIRRLRIEVGDTAAIRVARVDHETLEVVPEDQWYTRLSLDRWRYEDESGFVAELPVDSNGLVLDYPGLFRRLV
jgi:uncharacterized protein